MTRKKIAFFIVSSSILVLFLGAALFGQVAPKDNVYKYISVFTEVFSLVKSNYVEDVPSDRLVDGAFSGVTDAIDEYSYYVPPAQMALYRQHQENDANGIGLSLTKRYGYAYVISPVKGSLADRAGIKAGDLIEKINDQPLAHLAVWQVRDALARPETDGKPLRLTYVHSGQTKREIAEIRRAPYAAPLPSMKRYGTVAYISIPDFVKGTSTALSDQLQKVRTSGATHLIIDVRGNSGGDVDEAIHSADLLLKSGVITTTAGRRVESKRFEADAQSAYDGDLEVLTDRSTASGAEVFAAALHGNGRGKTVGLTTYGKAIIQKLIPLPSGGALFMTVAHYTTPDAKPIKEQGIRPDVTVDMTPNLVAGPDEKQQAPQDDLILKKALALFGEDPAKVAA